MLSYESVLGAESILILRQSTRVVLLGSWPIYIYNECVTDKTSVFKPAGKLGGPLGLRDKHFSLIPGITLSPALSAFLKNFFAPVFNSYCHG